jgi:hypothetical protein
VNSSLSKKVSDRLISPFNLDDHFSSGDLSRKLSSSTSNHRTCPSTYKLLNSNPPHITSAVDDVMYIVNKVIQQSLATSQRAVVSNVLPTIARVLGSDFVGMIQRKMRDETYPKAAIPGALPPEHTNAFLVLLNNLDVATDYTKRIVRTQVDSSSKSTSVDSDNPSSTSH